MFVLSYINSASQFYLGMLILFVQVTTSIRRQTRFVYLYETYHNFSKKINLAIIFQTGIKTQDKTPKLRYDTI